MPDADPATFPLKNPPPIREASHYKVSIFMVESSRNLIHPGPVNNFCDEAFPEAVFHPRCKFISNFVNWELFIGSASREGVYL